MPFEFEKLKLDGLVLVKPRVFQDARGFFIESYKKKDFALAGIPEEFVQDNHSKSAKGVLRGLHYQRGAAAQGKLLRCISGAILDELSAVNAHMLYLPPGFAHGFLVLSETAEIIYKCTTEYSPGDEGGIAWNDPAIGVDWTVSFPVLSPRDSELPCLKDAEL